MAVANGATLMGSTVAVSGLLLDQHVHSTIDIVVGPLSEHAAYTVAPPEGDARFRICNKPPDIMHNRHYTFQDGRVVNV